MDMFKVLHSYRIDTHNKYRAIELTGSLDLNPDGYRRLIGELVGQTDVNIGDDEAKHTAMYLVDALFDPEADSSLDRAQERAQALLARYPHLLVKDESTEDNTNVRTNADGVVLGATGKPRKGYKKQAATELWHKHKNEITERKDWIALFCKEISGMDKAVANTYLHNFEKGKWA